MRPKQGKALLVLRRSYDYVCWTRAGNKNFSSGMHERSAMPCRCFSIGALLRFRVTPAIFDIDCCARPRRSWEYRAHENNMHVTDALCPLPLKRYQL